MLDQRSRICDIAHGDEQFTVCREGPWSRTSRRLESRGRQRPVVRHVRRRKPRRASCHRTPRPRLVVGEPAAGIADGASRPTRPRSPSSSSRNQRARHRRERHRADRRRHRGRARADRHGRTTPSRSSSRWPEREPAGRRRPGRPDGSPAGARGRERRTARRHGRRAAVAPRRRKPGRTTAAIVLILLGALLAPVAVVGKWARDLVVDTDAYVATVAPIASDPGVQAAVTNRVTTAVVDALNVDELTTQACGRARQPGPAADRVDRHRSR